MEYILSVLNTLLHLYQAQAWPACEKLDLFAFSSYQIMDLLEQRGRLHSIQIDAG